MPREIWLDPNTEEAAAAQGCLTLACVPALGLVTNIWQTGEMTLDEADKVCIRFNEYCVGLSKFNSFQCIELCQERCRGIHSVVAQALLESQTS